MATDVIMPKLSLTMTEGTISRWFKQAEEVAMAVHPHPTVSEIIPEAFHAALGKAIHFV